MAEPIRPASQSLSSPQATANVPLLSKQMREEVTAMADQLQRLVNDPSLATQPSFLDEFAKNATQLNRTVDQAIQAR